MTPYQDLRKQVEALTPDEQLQLLEDLAAMVRHRVSPKPYRSMTELEGLGRELWQGMDAQEYVDRERDSWLTSQFH